MKDISVIPQLRKGGGGGGGKTKKKKRLGWVDKNDPMSRQLMVISSIYDFAEAAFSSYTLQRPVV
jgi:hypothetical protein